MKSTDAEIQAALPYPSIPPRVPASDAPATWPDGLSVDSAYPVPPIFVAGQDEPAPVVRQADGGVAVVGMVILIALAFLVGLPLGWWILWAVLR